jgi:hypothetical protein
MSEIVKLRNDGPTNAGCASKAYNLYYPRLQVNKHGEIVLALSRSENGLTRGLLVGRVAGSNPQVFGVVPRTLPIGKRFDDWEVGGELTDYDGEVTITFKNNKKAS